MSYFIARRGTSPATLQRRYGSAQIIDVTSRGSEPWVRFSPFYPHGDIPVPLSPGYVGASVEGIWQGLKVFEEMDIDLAKFKITNMTSSCSRKNPQRVYVYIMEVKGGSYAFSTSRSGHAIWRKSGSPAA